MTPQEKQEADKKVRETRDDKFRCIELASRRADFAENADEIIKAAKKFHEFMTA